MIADKRLQLWIKERPLDRQAADRIRTVEYDDLQLVRRTGLQDVAERCDVGVEAAADVLDVVNERVDAFELLGARSLPLAVQAVNRQAGFLVLTVGHQFVDRTADAVFRAEKGDQLDARRLVEQVDGAVAVTVQAG